MAQGRFRLLERAALFAGLGLVLGAFGAGACGTFGSSQDGSGGDTSGTSVGSGDPDGSTIDVAPDGEKPSGPIDYTALCGPMDGRGACLPGELEPCAPPMPNNGSGGAGGAGTGGAGGAGGGGGGIPETFGCQVASIAGDPMPICVAVGSGDDQAPCQTSADCGAGLGCAASGVGADPGPGLCRPYCCGELEACPTATYCAPQPMFDDSSLQIPVCVPAKPCPLLTDGACAAGETCTVVRADGTTSCVEEGAGQVCDACPCAAGYVCSVGTGTCQRLCDTDGADQCGGTTGTCQGGSNLPSGIGVCIGGDAACDV